MHGLYPERLDGLYGSPLGEACPQVLVDDGLEGPTRASRFSVKPRGNIFVQRQGCSHSIKMLSNRHHDVNKEVFARRAPSNPRPRHYKLVLCFNNLPSDARLRLARRSTTEHDRFPQDSRNLLPPRAENTILISAFFAEIELAVAENKQHNLRISRGD
jgi:hypothetical protein